MPKRWKDPGFGGRVEYTHEGLLNEARSLFTPNKKSNETKDTNTRARGRLAERLTALGITQSTIDAAAKEGKISSEQKTILELATQGYSLEQMLDKGHLPYAQSSSVGNVLKRAEQIILRDYPSQPNPNFGKENSPEPESQRLSREFLTEYFSNKFAQQGEDKKLIPNREILAIYPTLSILADKQVTLAQVKEAYDLNPHLAEHFAVLLLILEDTSYPEIHNKLKIERRDIQSMFAAAITKILKKINPEKTKKTD